MRLATWIACAAVVLAPIAYMQRFGGIRDRKIDDALFFIQHVRAVVSQSAAAGHRLPTDDEGLDSLASGEDKILDDVPCDPWHHPYIYRRRPGKPGFVLYSSGFDGVDDHGAGDDVTTPDKSYNCETYDGECPGSGRRFERVGIVATFLGGVGWLVFTTARNAARRPRAPRAA